MATIQRFEDLEVWKRSRQLTNKIYACTKGKEFAKDFGLKDQIRRASISAMSNIAEGFDRSGNQEFIQFLTIAKGSVAEVRSQLHVASDQAYINSQTFELLAKETDEIGRMIIGLMKYLKSSSYRGTKYKKPNEKS